MKVVINNCFGGFSLSKKGVKRLAELQGRPCYFFVTGRDEDGKLNLHKHTPISENDDSGLFFSAFDIPNPDEVLADNSRWHDMTEEERERSNELYTQHSIDTCHEDRADPLLVQVVEELGPEADGSCAKLKIVEIPDGTDWEIDEYDGNEHIAEKHRTWS